MKKVYFNGGVHVGYMESVRFMFNSWSFTSIQVSEGFHDYKLSNAWSKTNMNGVGPERGKNESTTLEWILNGMFQVI